MSSTSGSRRSGATAKIRLTGECFSSVWINGKSRLGFNGRIKNNLIINIYTSKEPRFAIQAGSLGSI